MLHTISNSDARFASRFPHSPNSNIETGTQPLKGVYHGIGSYAMASLELGCTPTHYGAGGGAGQGVGQGVVGGVGGRGKDVVGLEVVDDGSD